MAGKALTVISSVWLREQRHICVVGHRMKPDCEPQGPRTPQRETPEQSEESHAQGVHPVLHGLEEIVDRTEDGRQRYGRWPEAHSLCQRGLRVAPVREFLSEAEQQEGCSP